MPIAFIFFQCQFSYKHFQLLHEDNNLNGTENSGQMSLSSRN